MVESKPQAVSLLTEQWSEGICERAEEVEMGVKEFVKREAGDTLNHCISLNFNKTKNTLTSLSGEVHG